MITLLTDLEEQLVAVGELNEIGTRVHLGTVANRCKARTYAGT